MTSTRDTQANADGPVVLITGAGRRVGAAVAQSLAGRGFRVALHASTSHVAAAELAKQLCDDQHEAVAVHADLRDEQATRAMIAEVRDRFGRIDALVNNAAIWHPKPLENVRADDVREHFEINALATFLCCQAAGLIMAQQRTGGAIVNIGDWAITRPYAGYSAYFASKGCIPTITRTMAVELAARNPRVRVNAILPGPVLFPDDLSEAERTQIVEATLVKRPGTPDDVAGAVLFLIENSFVTGVCLPVDGGRSIFAPPLE
jgi:pteridine reductase